MRYIAPARKAEKLVPVSEPVFEPEAKGPSRAEVRRASAEDVNSVDVDTVFSKMFEVMGTTDISRPDAVLTPVEIDLLVTEYLSVRSAKDVIEGRETALKAFATENINNALSYDGKDSSTESGVLISVEHGVKLSKEVSGGKLTVDVDKLRENLDDDQFFSIVNVVEVIKKVTYPGGKTVHEEETVYELNEDALERQLKLGNVGMEQIVTSTVPSKTRTALYVRPLK